MNLHQDTIALLWYSFCCHLYKPLCTYQLTAVIYFLLASPHLYVSCTPPPWIWPMCWAGYWSPAIERNGQNNKGKMRKNEFLLTFWCYLRNQRKGDRLNTSCNCYVFIWTCSQRVIIWTRHKTDPIVCCLQFNPLQTSRLLPHSASSQLGKYLSTNKTCS